MTEQVLKGQIAIVTGASSGIGTGCAKALARAGATVVVNYPFDGAAAAAQAVADEIKNDGGAAIIYKCDVSKENEVIRMFEDTVKQFGTVDILVNNAGVQKDAPLLDMTIDQWNTVIGINLTGQFLCAREAIREFLRRGVQPRRSRGRCIAWLRYMAKHLDPPCGRLRRGRACGSHVQDAESGR